MDSFTIRELLQIRQAARSDPYSVQCPRCTTRLGRTALMKLTNKATYVVAYHCPNCGEDVKVNTA